MRCPPGLSELQFSAGYFSTLGPEFAVPDTLQFVTSEPMRPALFDKALPVSQLIPLVELTSILKCQSLIQIRRGYSILTPALHACCDVNWGMLRWLCCLWDPLWALPGWLGPQLDAVCFNLALLSYPNPHHHENFIFSSHLSLCFLISDFRGSPSITHRIYNLNLRMAFH